MSTELATIEATDQAQGSTPATAVTLAQTAWTPEQRTVLENAGCAARNEADWNLFLFVCQRTGLDPFARQIYMVNYGGKPTVQTGIDGYRVIRALGAGGMGQVFLVEHPRLPRRDALKLLDAGVSRSDDFKANAEAAGLSPAQYHPAIAAAGAMAAELPWLWARPQGESVLPKVARDRIARALQQV